MTNDYPLPENQCEPCPLGVAAGEVQAAVVGEHYLTGEAEAYAGAVGLGRVERDENLVAGRWGDGGAVIGHVYECLFILVYSCHNRDIVSTGLDCILYQVDQDAADLGLVGIYENVLVRGLVCTGAGSGNAILAGEFQDVSYQVIYHQGLLYWPCHAGQFAV